MPREPSPSDLLGWYIEAGADEAIGETPRNRFEQSVQEVESPKGAESPAPPPAAARRAATVGPPAAQTAREIAASCATIDELTGLSNLRGFKMLSRQALAMCRSMKRPATLLSFDLDGFKAINDTFGHAAGDAALASFSADLLANFRDSDVVARLGGDEFCVLLSGASAKEMPVTLDKLATIISKRNEGRDEVAHLRYSVGAVAFDPEAHESASELLKEADALMYENKRRER